MRFDQLSDEEKMKISAEVDYFVGTILSRYGLKEADIPEVMDSLRWLKEHRQFMQRVQQGSTMSLLAMLVAALGTTVWAGVKALISAGAK